MIKAIPNAVHRIMDNNEKGLRTKTEQKNCGAWVPWVPACTNEVKLRSKESECLLVRSGRGTERVAESSQRWEMKLSSHPQGQWDNSGVRNELTALCLDLVSYFPKSLFSMVGWGGGKWRSGKWERGWGGRESSNWQAYSPHFYSLQ